MAFMLPLAMMGPAWAGRFGFHCCRLRRCRAACGCGSCDETVAIEPPKAAIATDSGVIEPLAPQDHTPAPMPEPTPHLQSAVVAPASAEEPATEPAASEEPETKPEVMPETEPKPEPAPEPAPAPEVTPAPAPEVPAPDVKPEPEPEPPVEKNIFEDADDEWESPKTDEDAPAEMPATPEDDEKPAPSEGEDSFAGHGPVPVEPMRRWIDDTGDHATIGRLVEVYPDRVRILKLNGAHTTVSLDRLSSADRNYVAATGERIAAKPRVTDTVGL